MLFITLQLCLAILAIPLNGQSQQSRFTPTFYLYTRNNARTAERLPWSDNSGSGNLRSSQFFNGARNTKMIVHGFMDSPSIGQWMTTMKDRFLAADNQNVIIVDWSNANQFPYGSAVGNSMKVGRSIGSFIRALGSNPSQFHILGHSLGAHVAGFAGKSLNGQLGQITGLDPAGPAFEGSSPQSRLWRTDAQFVDVIHTDAGSFGMWQTCGNVDIFPNGGRNQPGCTQERLSFFTRGFLDGARTLFACDHQRAVDYYSEAINSSSNSSSAAPIAYQCDSYDNFRAGKCNNCGQYGGRCVRIAETSRNKPIRQSSNGGGRFFINTASSSPYFRK